MNKLNNIKLWSLLISLFFSSCKSNSPDPIVESEKKEFKSSFENVEDFSGFYLTPQDYQGTSFHELSDTIVRSGTYAHRAWIDGANPPSITTNNNHRGYPTVQLQKTTEGVFKTPAYVTLWVWLDMELQQSNNGGEEDWFSFATFTDDESDNWAETVLVNLSKEGFVHLMHVPTQGKKEYIFQTNTIAFPQKEWVELTIYLDFSSNGYAKVWQNGTLVSHAKVEKAKNQLAQAHFGLYCPPQMVKGVVYNDDLWIREVDNE